jgi:hypothetical protein
MLDSLVRVSRRVGRIRKTYSPQTAAHHSDEDLAAAKNPAAGDRPVRASFTGSREPFRVRNRTARPVAAGSASARPARLLRHGCAGKSLYNDREADQSEAPGSVAQAYDRKDRRPEQLAHPHPVSRAQVSTDKEASTRGRTTCALDRSRRPTEEAVRIPAASTASTGFADTTPSTRPVRAAPGSKDRNAPVLEPRKRQGTLRSSRSSFGKSARLPLGGFTHS